MKGKIVTYCSVCLASLIIGFFAGRKTASPVVKIEYIKQPPVYGTIHDTILIPIKEEIPNNPILPVKTDTFYIYDTNIKYITLSVDTAAIIADYVIKRNYDITAFDNKDIGTLKLFPIIQYNKIAGLDYLFTPITKTTTIYREKVWQPFISGGYSTFNIAGIGGGVFYHDIGIEYQYLMSLQDRKNGHFFKLKYKF